jgi:transposase InsO family protein
VGLFKKKPSSKEMQRMIEKAIINIRGKPKHIITDQGREFYCKSFRKFCRQKHKIGLRFGAVQKYGSISVVERFMRTLKSECTRKILVPLDIESMRDEVSSFVNWYNCFRPHQGLKGTFPIERYFGKPKRKRPYNVKGPDPEIVKMFISYLDDKEHLPVVKLRKVS